MRKRTVSFLQAAGNELMTVEAYSSLGARMTQPARDATERRTLQPALLARKRSKQAAMPIGGLCPEPAGTPSLVP